MSLSSYRKTPVTLVGETLIPMRRAPQTIVRAIFQCRRMTRTAVFVVAQTGSRGPRYNPLHVTGGRLLHPAQRNQAHVAGVTFCCLEETIGEP